MKDQFTTIPQMRDIYEIIKSIFVTYNDFHVACFKAKSYRITVHPFIHLISLRILTVELHLIDSAEKC